MGIPPNHLGRIPRAVLTVLEENAKLLVFGTGASEKNRMKEADYTLWYLLEHFSELAEFKAFQGIDLNALKKQIDQITVTETISQTTREEVKFAGEIFLKKGINRVILVSDPTHIYRCLREAQDVYSQDPNLRPLSRNLFATTSDICLPGTTSANVAIVEPSHRLDRPQSPLNFLVNKIFQIPAEKRNSFEQKFGKLINKYLNQ